MKNGAVIFSDNNYNKAIFDKCLLGACYSNSPQIVKFAIDNGGNDWNGGLMNACVHNNVELIKLTIQYGANDWNEALIYACCNGSSTSLESIQYMIECGANSWNSSLRAACKYGNINFVKLMIQYGADNLNVCFVKACEYGHTEIAILLMNYGANDWNKGLAESCKKNNVDLMNLIIHKGATNLELIKDINEFKLACYYAKHIGGDPVSDAKCNDMLKTYPVYVLLCFRYIPYTSKIPTKHQSMNISQTVEIKTNCLKKLPQEIFRLLHQYF